MQCKSSVDIKVAAVLAGVLVVNPFQTLAQSVGEAKEKLKKIEYTMIRLGPGVARAINASGTVVGTTTGSDGLPHAFVWTAARGMVDLGTNGVRSEAVDINRVGQVLGSTTPTDALTNRFATIWTGGVAQVLAYSTYTLPMAISERGEAVLTFPNYATNHNSLLFWSPSTGFVVPNVVRGYGVSINSSGQVAGLIDFWLPIRWDPKSNVVTNLGPAQCGGAAAINDAGHIAGWCDDRAFRWTERDGFVTLPVPLPDHPSSMATSINDAGWIAGTALGKHGVPEAVLWDPSNRLVELGLPSPHTLVQDVIALNDLNLVVGNYREIGSYVARPFLAGPGVGFLDLSEGGFQLVRWSMGNAATGPNAPLPQPLNNALQIIGYAGPDAVLLQPSLSKEKK